MKRFILMSVVLFQNSFGQWYLSDWPVDDPTDFYFKDSLSGLIIGYGSPYITKDGGNNWFTPEQTQARFLSSQLCFINNNIGFGYRYSIQKTKDMGYTWIDITPNGFHEFMDMYFINDTTGYVVGGNGEIYITHNQGDNWQDISYSKNNNTDLYSVYFIDENNGWIYGSDTWGFKLVTSDGGIHWNKIGTDNVIIEKQFLNKSIGYAHTHALAQLVKTTDGGDSWEIITTPLHELGSLFFINNDIGFISGGIAIANYSYGRIYKTIDGCKTWKEIYSSNISSIVGKIYFLNENYGWAISSLGILRTRSGGLTSIGKSIAQSDNNNSLLLCNYPNPFNPTTTISFILGSRCYVSLQIIDLLGRKVETVVSEELPAGRYSRQWNASKMSGGIYYSYLHAGSFVETKKIVFLK